MNSAASLKVWREGIGGQDSKCFYAQLVRPYLFIQECHGVATKGEDDKPRANRSLTYSTDQIDDRRLSVLLTFHLNAQYRKCDHVAHQV